MRRIWKVALLPVLVLAVSAAAPPAMGVPAQKKVLVDFRKEGGFAGLQDHMIVYGNGCVRLDRRTGPTIDKCLTAKEERRLQAYLKDLRIGRSETRPPGADFIAYRLAYKERQTTRYTLPVSWRPVVRELDKIMEKYWAPD
ncbi:hypothetical protein [Nonomuraea sp. 10N515B]|uniref:hypothetical protein n=1 Tax=Nonomuraea sp. 10N515B TaxID=3457422 RepID=UPI003FCE5470